LDAKEKDTNDSKAPSEQPGDAVAGKRKFSVGSILPVVAFAVSIFSLYVSEGARRDVARIDVIKTEYGLYYDMARLRLQYPLMAHLLTENGESYDSESERIRLATASIKDHERANLLLQERGLAHYVFTGFEETYYLWREAQGGEKRRASLLLEQMMYFNNLLCGNPRLLWYWDTKGGGKLGREFSRDLRSYYQDNVIKNCAIDKDSEGPFRLTAQAGGSSQSPTVSQHR
jgi:hypothetical protein